MNEVSQARPNTNGHAVGPSDDAVVAPLKARVDELHARRDALVAQREELTSQIDEVTHEAKRYEKAMAVINGEPLRKRSEPIGEPTQGAKRKGGTRISDERLAVIEGVIRRLAAESDDFTQVAVRTQTGDGSGPMAIAFEILRQRNVIRFVRRDGNTKVFRLTREALAGQHAS
jgi:hypothetical protein